MSIHLQSNGHHGSTAAPSWREVAVIALLALWLYLTIFGIATLVPTNVTWMLQGDPAQHYLGWQFFRSEGWQWPPGRIAGFGYPAGAAIGFTDSIPLLALPLKPFSALLPAEFQYFGLWMLVCFVLTGYFGLRLIARTTQSSAVRVLAASFFMLSPTLLLRGYGHEALMAHWLLLAAIERNLDAWSPKRWGWLVAVSALCHPYLLLMVLGLLSAAAAAAVVVDKALGWRRATAQVAVLLACALGLMYLAGYFHHTGSLAAEGYGYYSMNLLSFVDPLLGWSNFLRQYPIHPDYAQFGNFGQYEGFQYLGAGMLLLLPAALALLLAQPLRLRAAIANAQLQRLLPLVLVAVAFWLAALSNVILWADQRLLVIPLPEWLHQLLSIFRASGRFGWPLFYLVYLGALWAIVKYLSPWRAALLLAPLLLLQVADQSDKYRELHVIMDKRMAWQTPLTSPQWGQWAGQVRALVLVPPLPNLDKAYIPLAQLAARHHLPTNAANISRAEVPGQPGFGETAAADLLQGRMNPQYLYVFLSPDVPDRLPPALRQRIVAVDGFWALAPVNPH